MSPSVHFPVPVLPEDRHRIHNRNGPVVVHHKGRVIVWGGDNESILWDDESRGPLGWNPEDAYYLDTLDQTWYYQQMTGDLPRHTCYVAAQVVDNKLYVIGGSITRAELNGIGENAARPESNESGEEALEEEETRWATTRERAQQYSNDVHSLDLSSWKWTKLAPSGRKPRNSFMASSWQNGDNIYIFGGAGEIDEQIWGTHNDLAAYDTARNEWWWPQCSGQAPSPRNDHASFAVCNEYNRAYVFGRWVLDVNKERRRGSWPTGEPANDLYSLDMTSWKWQELMKCTAHDKDNTIPQRRRGHTLTMLPPLLLHQSSSKDGVTTALLYGGTGVSASMIDSLGDCWMLHVDASSSSSVPNYNWDRCAHLEKGLRSLHGAVSVPETGQLFLVGGCIDRITWSWAKRALKVPVTPPSLKELAVITLVDQKKRVESAVRRLGPLSLQTLFDKFQELRLEEREQEEEESETVKKLRRGELGVCEW